jgi:hypothetical protein
MRSTPLCPHSFELILTHNIKQQMKEDPLGDPIVLIAPTQSTFQLEQAFVIINHMMRFACPCSANVCVQLHYAHTPLNLF